ncbi:nuclear pore complex protein Nup107-like protein [Anopheles sinensis]|uniref:Nuclear pore complex protein Nup107-like protein n=1 Tax=Anopheles sinensis TaxID=74873 RepID=A0A084W5T0_ANOSI|nr:nuclear pore complex protein Nup107-like protein [Anopheles sinensis]
MIPTSSEMILLDGVDKEAAHIWPRMATLGVLFGVLRSRWCFSPTPPLPPHLLFELCHPF